MWTCRHRNDSDFWVRSSSDFSLPLFTTLATGGQFNPAAAEYPLDFRDVHIEGVLHWSQTTIRHGLLFDGAFVGGEVDFSEATIEDKCSFTGGQFASIVRLDDVEILGSLSLDHAEFELAVTMAASAVDGGVTFEDSHVHAPEGGDERLESEDCTLGEIYGPESQVGESLRFTSAKIESDTRFVESDIGGLAKFNNADIGCDTEFNDADIGRDAEFESATVERVSLQDANFRDDATLSGDVGENPSLTGLHVNGTLTLDLPELNAVEGCWDQLQEWFKYRLMPDLSTLKDYIPRGLSAITEPNIWPYLTGKDSN